MRYLLLDLKTFQMVILIISTTRRDRNHPACLTDGGNEVKKKKKLVSDLPKDVFGFKSLSSVRDGERGFS